MTVATIDAHDLISNIYQRESRRVFATLVRLLGDFDLAEDALQDAFAAAVIQWPRDGIPDNPRAWLVSTGRFKSIDGIRKRARFDASLAILARELDDRMEDEYDFEEDEGIRDDRLKLIFTCCNPALSPEARVALTLREVCGLTTEEIARAFLITPSTLAQRIVRAKNKIRDAGIPYQVPGPNELPERLDTVLQVIYLVFSEGYFASSGETVIRSDLTGEAIRLARLLRQLLPEPDVSGLLALMLLHESRRDARTDIDGNLILLDDQDRSRWNRALIDEGVSLVEDALRSRQFGSYTLQAAISAVHATSPAPEATDWPEIVVLYDLLLATNPSPVVALNRAVAVAMRDGPESGIPLVEAILDDGKLQDYPLAWSTHGELLRRAGEHQRALASYRKALDLSQQEPARRYLEEQIADLRKTEAV
ncbi:MAG: RNA polymerase sigma factor [Thermomicrobiales bacterium]|nr:RNA polymerase sigma factor [Thermomicrobiales bacterium]